MFKKYIFILSVLTIMKLNLFGDVTVPFGMNLEQAQLETLLDGGVIMGRMDSSAFPLSLPFHSLTNHLISRFPIDVYGDILFIRKRHDYLNDNEYLLNALNTFLLSSEQKGIQYNSDSKGWITLINDSYAITEKGKKIENIQFESLPQETELYVYQNDYYFSGNKFHYEVSTVTDGIRIRSTNINNMRVKGLFKAIDKEKLNMEFYILTDGEYVCVYGIALVDDLINPVEAFGLKVDIPSAMSKRMSSVILWFLNKLDETI